MRHLLLPWLLCLPLAAQEPVAAAAGAELPPLPRAVASFGAAGSGDAIFAFGGHVGTAHDHSRDNVVGQFHRLDLTAGRSTTAEWRALAEGPPLQGTSLVAAADGTLYRVGGMTARNAPDEAEDMHSTATVQRFDPEGATWRDVTPLPDGRSSHDACVVDNRLYVVGGWTLAGEDGTWSARAWVADLATEPLVWRDIAPPPTQRRALAVAPVGGRLAAIGGLDRDGNTTRKVAIYDPQTDRWRCGPEYPGRGFAVAAAAVGDHLVCSGRDGAVYSLDPSASQWREVARLRAPRFFHRLVATAQGVYALGGAGRGGHMDSVERVEFDRPVRSEPDVWQGLRGDGRSQARVDSLPVKWGEDHGWTAAIAGYGQSSPVVWGDRVFVTSAEGAAKETCIVTCFRVSTGARLWERRAEAGVRIEATDMVSRAAPSPVVDGERVYAFFESGDLLAFDHDGNEVWHQSVAERFGGAYQGNHGFGSSLALSSQGIVLALDHDGPSFVATFARDTGAARWCTQRTSRISWSTPVVRWWNGEEEIVVSSNGSVDGYAGASGELLWSVPDVRGNTVPSPTWAGDLIVVGASKGDNFAIRRSADGAEIAWTATGVRPCGFSSPVFAGGLVLVINKAGVLFAIDAGTGEGKWQQRLAEPCWATPVVVGDLVYCFGKSGTTTILRPGAEGGEIVAENRIATEDSVYGVAIAGRAILLREGSLLRCISRADDVR